jgi:hypothetical protein
MHQHSVTLDFPEELYKRIREAAEENRMPLESMLLESIALMYGDSLADNDLSPEALEQLADDQLWAIVHRQLVLPLDIRLRQLTALGKSGSLSNDEQAEMERLIAEVDRCVVLRSNALLLLKTRGYDVEQRLKIGA